MIIRTRRRQQGQVFLIFALAAVALFGVAGLAIDGGRALMDQRNLQNAVDGAALSGANDLGPGTDAQSQANAMDDTVYSLEQSLGISFSSNYGGLGHRLLGQQCGREACYSGNPTGPYNASNAASPCCINWLDSTSAYTLNITTPYSFGGTTDPEAFIKVDLVHQLPVLIAGSLVPNINVHVQSTARNYAIPYAIFTFKWNDDNAINEVGGGGLTATKRIGTNGTASLPTGGSGSLTFTCPGGKYGGDPACLARGLAHHRWVVHGSLPMHSPRNSVVHADAQSPGDSAQRTSARRSVPDQHNGQLHRRLGSAGGSHLRGCNPEAAADAQLCPGQPDRPAVQFGLRHQWCDPVSGARRLLLRRLGRGFRPPDPERWHGGNRGMLSCHRLWHPRRLLSDKPRDLYCWSLVRGSEYPWRPRGLRLPDQQR
jgi:hypothetical protein